MGLAHRVLLAVREVFALCAAMRCLLAMQLVHQPPSSWGGVMLGQAGSFLCPQHHQLLCWARIAERCTGRIAWVCERLRGTCCLCVA